MAASGPVTSQPRSAGVPSSGPMGMAGELPGSPGPLPPVPGRTARGGLPGARPNRGLAVASLILGAVALPLDLIAGAGFLVAIPAAILGGAALSKIGQTGEKGRGLAAAGLIVGCAAAVLAVFAFYTELSYLAVECARDGGC